MENKIREIRKNAIEKIGNPLAEVISGVIVESYQIGLQQASGWISVKVCMPTHLQVVNAALYNAKTNSFSYYIGWYNKEQEQWYLNDYGYTESVTHWMPIPEIKPIGINQ